MQYAFLPVFLLVACTIGLAVGLLGVASLFNPGRPGRVTRMPYESGMDPIHDTRRRFDVRFHLLAIAFMVFDVELLFLYPWAVAMKGERGEGREERETVTSGQWLATGKPAAGDQKSRVSGFQSPAGRPSSFSPLPAPLAPSRHLVFAGAMTFLALLAVGYVYDWRKGVFQWR